MAFPGPLWIFCPSTLIHSIASSQCSGGQAMAMGRHGQRSTAGHGAGHACRAVWSSRAGRKKEELRKKGIETSAGGRLKYSNFPVSPQEVESGGLGKKDFLQLRHERTNNPYSMMNQSSSMPPAKWRDVTFNVQFGILLLSLLITITWFTFLTFYLSRVFGVIFTWVFNFFFRQSARNRLQVGSISISVLSGKLMFRNLKYFSEDFTVRVMDGWIVFRYWRRYVPRVLGDDFSHEDPRLFSHLNGVEVHVYNWSEKYQRIAELFGLDFGIMDDWKADAPVKRREDYLRKRQERWRSLFPVFHFQISSGRFSFGNNHLPTTLMMSLENAVGVYTTKPPSRPQSEDLFMHSLRGTCENFRVAFVKTPTYTGTLWEEPPRTMGEGFVLLQTAQMEYYYYQDELGLVEKERRQNLEEGSGPAWGTDFRLGKNTIISYGPWADKQRDYLYKFFYPPDYQGLQITSPPTRQGKERRIHTHYDVRVTTLNDSTMDILFMRGEDPNALHLDLKQGSYWEVSVPLVVKEDGYRTKVTGQLMHMEASTSLEYRPLMACETLEFAADLKYSRAWNGHQLWDFSFTGCKTTIHVVFDLKYFLHDLMNEWADQNPPDLLKFVPWTCRFNAGLADFELIMAGLNPHNWIDTSSIDEENIQAGICGKRLELGFSLPFTVFQPETTKIRFWTSGESLELRVRLPEQHILHHIIKCVDAAKQAMVSLVYDFHPMPTQRQSHLPESARKGLAEEQVSAQNFRPTEMVPDQIRVEVELGPSHVQFSSLIINLIFALKENYFGECDRISNIEGFSTQTVKKMYGKMEKKELFDPRKYRPLHVTVSVLLHDIQANCMLYSTAEDCPVAHVEQLAFEMDKRDVGFRFLETRLQLNLSPIVVKLLSGQKEGEIVLSGFQFRGHAMFSNSGLPVDSPTSEYAWLMEVILGDLMGRIRPSHLVHIVQFMETFLFMLTNSEEDLPYPKSLELCQHMNPRSQCPETGEGSECSTEHGLKYKLARVSLDNLNLSLEEDRSVVQVLSSNFRLATCNLHSADYVRGVSLRLPSFTVKQFVWKGESLSEHNWIGPDPTVGSTGTWLECGLFRLSHCDFNLALPMLESEANEKRREFVQRHDSRKMLTFLWDDHSNNECGCQGRCAFFGKNLFGKRFFGEAGNFAVLSLHQNENAATWDDPGFGQSILRRGEAVLTRSAYPDGAESSGILSPHLITVSESAQFLQEEFFLAPETWGEAIEDWRDEDGDMGSPTEGSGDSLDSFKTSVSHPASSLVNLYGQVNRPVLTSPMLMTGYGKYLNQYKCHNWREKPRHKQGFNSKMDLNFIPEFSMVKQGFNSLALIYDAKKDAELIASRQTQEKMGGSSAEREEPGTERKRSHPVEEGASVEAIGKVGESLDILLSPLGVEVIQRMVESCGEMLSHPHPVYILESLFHSCSSRKHSQPLVEDSSATSGFSPIYVRIVLPKMNLSFFQCGVVEKMVPFGELSTVPSLTQASVALAAVSDITWSVTTTHCPRNDEFGGYIVTGNTNVGTVNCQVVQIAETSGSNIGISKSASRSPFFVNWNSLGPVKDMYKPCVVMENCVRQSYLTIRKGVSCSWTKGGKEDSKEDDNTKTSGEPETSALIHFGPTIVNFGLCQPLDAAKDSWPLYDVLAPSLTAWVHVIHRLEVSCLSMAECGRLVRELTLAWLLTEALECSSSMNVYNPPKSKFSAAKENSRRLRLCPSCQLSLVMLRFCSKTVGSWDFQERMKVEEGVKKVQHIRKGVVALLSHWRPVLCYERLVTLDSALARKITEKSEERALEGLAEVEAESPSPSPSVPDPPKKIGAMAARTLSKATQDKPQPISQDSSPPDSEPGLTEKGMGSQNSAVKSSRRAGDGEKATNGGGSSRKQGRRMKESGLQSQDLYKWMRDQPKTEEKKGGRTPGGVEEVNPMDVPLSLYFKPIFDSEHLEIGSDLMKFLDSLGGTFGFSVHLQEIKIGTVEPKQLTMVGSTSKRVGYTERLFLELEGIEAKGKLTTEPETGSGGNSGGFPIQRVTRHLNYEASVGKVSMSAGFPSASFLNQMNFVVRSVMDSHSELKRNLSKNSEEEQGSLFGTPRLKGLEGGMDDSMSGGGEGVRPWCERMMSLMSDYFKSQKRQWTKEVSWSSEDLALAFVINGAVHISVINVQGILRELVVYVTVNKLQLGHSARERKSAEEKSQRVAESSYTASMHRGIFILSEMDCEAAKSVESKLVIFQLTVNDSRLLLSRQLLQSSSPDVWENSLLVEVGPVLGDVPMHPGVLHGVVMRTTRNIQREFERLNAPPQVIEEVPQEKKKPEETVGHYSRSLDRVKGVAVVNFSLALCSLTITASLLPSLRATYKFEEVNSSGTTGPEAKFVVEVPKHGITFDVQGVTETPDGPLQPIKLALPVVTANGSYVQASAVEEARLGKDRALVYQEGGYLKIDVSIGKFEHTLTTYLLNQLLFVQEAFRREIGDIVSRITAEREPLLLPGSSLPGKKVLFAVSVRGPEEAPFIQLTATTPTSTAVRLTVEHVFGQLTNRWLRRGQRDRGDTLHGTASVQLSLVLGQFIKNAMFEEVEPEFQQFAYFKTHIQVENVETETDLWMERGPSYTYLIRVHRPIVFIQPSAVDKAVLLWLNYKNTYEFWNEQRHQIRTNRRTSFLSDAAQAGIGSIPLFLKLSVDSGIYICMPLYSAQYPDTNSALLLSLDETDIQVCSKGSLVSRGSFTGFCIRFVEDFDAVAENWRPERERPEGSNACFVPEGTYSLCSKTSAPRPGNANAEWILNVKWQMKGMDLQLNTRIGKLTSLLLATLTSLAGEGEESLTVPGSEKELSIVSDVIEQEETTTGETEDIHSLPDGKKRTKAIERAMNDQARVVTDLKEMGATEATIELERRKLQKLEAALFTEFRKEMVDKLRRQSQKATSIKDRLGLAVKPPPSATRKTTDHFGSVDKINGGRRLSEFPVRQSPSRRRRGRNHVRAGSLDTGFERPASASSSAEGEDSPSSDGTGHTASPYEDSLGTQEDSSVRLRQGGILEESTAPAVDLYLDVEIEVEKGKCVLHKQPREDPEGGPLSARSSSGKGGDKRRSTPRTTLQMPRISQTTIDMPSVIVKSYYASHSGKGENSGLNVNQLKDDGLDEGLISHMKSSMKKGNLFLSTALESMPQETVVSPHLLDFLQETLEAIPHAHHFFPSRKDSNPPDENEKKDELSEEEGGVERMIPLEAENAAVVSFPVDIVLFFSVQQSSIRFTSQPDSMMECLLKLPQLNLICTSRKASDMLFNSASIRPPDPNSGLEEERNVNFSESLNGGIYCTAVFKDFSLFIFHPYGVTSGSGAMPGSVPRELGGRDALSLTVDNITISISRSRNLLTAANLESDCNRLKNSVHFSLLVGIGKASFKYDMRKLKEILSFPKAWYRNAIMRRLFLGDESGGGGTGKGRPGSRPPTPRTEQTLDSRDTPSQESGGAVSLGVVGLKSPTLSQTTASKTAWEALVVFTVQCGELEVDANMGQTMGLTSWITKKVSLTGNVNINSRGHKHCNGILGLESSVLDAKTGIISGIVDLAKVRLVVGLKRSEGKTPEHQIRAQIGNLSTRVEWMSSTTLVGRSWDLDFLLKDEWKQDDANPLDPQYKSAVYLIGTLHWNKIKVLIAKSTASNFVRIYYKLAEFFQQHLKSGRGIWLRNYGREPNVTETKESPSVEEERSVLQKHHRHWQNPLAYITLIQYKDDFFRLNRAFPTETGGRLELGGGEICLGCFHGDFKAGKWAVAHLKEPKIHFQTQAVDTSVNVLQKDGTTEFEVGTKVTQSLAFRLGTEEGSKEEAMGVVGSVKQGRYATPPGTGSLDEWLRYALDSSVPQMYDDKAPRDRDVDNTPVALLRFPPAHITLKTEQTQTDADHTPHLHGPPDPSNTPRVNYSFHSTFYHHIISCSNVEELAFLNDLVVAYQKEMKQLAASGGGGTSGSKMSPVNRPDSSDHLQEDSRIFQCQEGGWELNPTVRFMEIVETPLYGAIEIILSRMGMKKPNETIPKKTQRHLLDPLDSGLAFLMENMLLLTQKM